MMFGVLVALSLAKADYSPDRIDNLRIPNDLVDMNIKDLRWETAHDAQKAGPKLDQGNSEFDAFFNDVRQASALTTKKITTGQEPETRERNFNGKEKRASEFNVFEEKDTLHRKDSFDSDLDQLHKSGTVKKSKKNSDLSEKRPVNEAIDPDLIKVDEQEPVKRSNKESFDLEFERQAEKERSKGSKKDSIDSDFRKFDTEGESESTKENGRSDVNGMNGKDVSKKSEVESIEADFRRFEEETTSKKRKTDSIDSDLSGFSEKRTSKKGKKSSLDSELSSVSEEKTPKKTKKESLESDFGGSKEEKATKKSKKGSLDSELREFVEKENNKKGNSFDSEFIKIDAPVKKGKKESSFEENLDFDENSAPKKTKKHSLDSELSRIVDNVTEKKTQKTSLDSELSFDENSTPKKTRKHSLDSELSRIAEDVTETKTKKTSLDSELSFVDKESSTVKKSKKRTTDSELSDFSNTENHKKTKKDSLDSDFRRFEGDTNAPKTESSKKTKKHSLDSDFTFDDTNPIKKSKKESLESGTRDSQDRKEKESIATDTVTTKRVSDEDTNAQALKDSRVDSVKPFQKSDDELPRTKQKVTDSEKKIDKDKTEDSEDFFVVSKEDTSSAGGLKASPAHSDSVEKPKTDTHDSELPPKEDKPSRHEESAEKTKTEEKTEAKEQMKKELIDDLYSLPKKQEESSDDSSQKSESDKPQEVSTQLKEEELTKAIQENTKTQQEQVPEEEMPIDDFPKQEPKRPKLEKLNNGDIWNVPDYGTKKSRYDFNEPFSNDPFNKDVSQMPPKSDKTFKTGKSDRDELDDWWSRRDPLTPRKKKKMRKSNADRFREPQDILRNPYFDQNMDNPSWRRFEQPVRDDPLYNPLPQADPMNDPFNQYKRRYYNPPRDQPVYDPGRDYFYPDLRRNAIDPYQNVIPGKPPVSNEWMQWKRDPLQKQMPPENERESSRRDSNIGQQDPFAQNFYGKRSGMKRDEALNDYFVPDNEFRRYPPRDLPSSQWSIPNAIPPNTRMQPDGSFVCLSGYVGSTPIDQKGCWKCNQECGKQATCEYPGVCKCKSPYQGDGTQCSLPAPVILSTEKLPNSAKVWVSFSGLDEVPSPKAFCKFDKVIAVGNVYRNHTVLCTLPNDVTFNPSLRLSFDGVEWSEPRVVTTLWFASEEFLEMWPVIAVGAAAIVFGGFLCYCCCCRKKKRVVVNPRGFSPDELLPLSSHQGSHEQPFDVHFDSDTPDGTKGALFPEPVGEEQ